MRWISTISITEWCLQTQPGISQAIKVSLKLPDVEYPRIRNEKEVGISVAPLLSTLAGQHRVWASPEAFHSRRSLPLSWHKGRVWVCLAFAMGTTRSERALRLSINWPTPPFCTIAFFLSRVIICFARPEAKTRHERVWWLSIRSMCLCAGERSFSILHSSE